MLIPDLFDFAYVPDWYGQLEELAQMALPEPWKFRKPATDPGEVYTYYFSQTGN